VSARRAHPPRRFWIEIAAVLAAKAVALTALYLIFFYPSPEPPDVPAHVFQIESAK